MAAEVYGSAPQQTPRLSLAPAPDLPMADCTLHRPSHSPTTTSKLQQAASPQPSDTLCIVPCSKHTPARLLHQHTDTLPLYPHLTPPRPPPPHHIHLRLFATTRGLSSFVPSLALLSEQLLGQPLRGRDPSAPLSSSQQQPQHDSREDASVALALVKLELQRGAASAPLDPPDLKVSQAVKLCMGSAAKWGLFLWVIRGASACVACGGIREHA
jgi:hypothetical protein